MRRSRDFVVMLLVCVCGAAVAETKKSKAPASSKPATPPPVAPVIRPIAKLETFIMLPEPKAMRTDRSRFLPDAKKTVISPAREVSGVSGVSGVKLYTPEEFAKLGISVDTFLERSRAAADRRLAALTPDYVKDDGGRVRYAVYRGDSSLIASLVIAPSLGRFFQKTFGGDVWAVLPDRHSLFIFPARPGAIAEFSSDLRDRFDSNPYAASSEIFLLKADGSLPRVVGTFGD